MASSHPVPTSAGWQPHSLPPARQEIFRRRYQAVGPGNRQPGPFSCPIHGPTSTLRTNVFNWRRSRRLPGGERKSRSLFIPWGSGDVSTGSDVSKQIVVVPRPFSRRNRPGDADARKVVETNPILLHAGRACRWFDGGKCHRRAVQRVAAGSVPTLGYTWSVKLDFAPDHSRRPRHSRDTAHTSRPLAQQYAAAEFAEYSKISRLHYGTPMPRPFVMRAKQASAKLTDEAAE